MKRKKWVRLDNAAKIFPPTSSKRDTKVFRLSCCLKEEVNKDYLQKALNLTLEDYPIYKMVLKKGLFWYYLEESDIKPIVSLEDKNICAPIYFNSESLLFRVNYFKKRINLEVYHVLADGVGALEFFKLLIVNYLVNAHPKELKGVNIDLDNNASLNEKWADSFQKYYDNSVKKPKINLKTSHTIKGTKYSESRLEVIEGIFNTKDIIDLAKKYNTTVTVLVVSVFMKAIKDEMKVRDLKKLLVITIPVNLRQFFKSKTARNFFGVFNVSYDFYNYPDNLESIIKYLNDFFEYKLNYEQMNSILNRFTTLEENYFTRSTPLFIKIFFLKLFNFFNSFQYTGQLSNVGKITMPKEVEEYIELFDVISATNKVQVSMCSYLDNMVISFTSPFVNTNIEKNFFKTFVNLGLNVKVTSNFNEEDYDE